MNKLLLTLCCLILILSFFPVIPIDAAVKVKSLDFQISSDASVPATLWGKNYGGANYEWGNSVMQTSDGGYLVTATKHADSASHSDVWVIKTDSSGNKQWDKTFGTLDTDSGISAIQTADNGYVIGYYSFSGGGDVRDFSLIKTDNNGRKQWEKTVNATNDDCGLAFIQTTDGGYVIVGSYGSLFLENYGELLIIKTTSNGDVLWYKTFDSPSTGDCGYSVVQSTDGGYVIAGRSGNNEWLIKTDSSGNRQWDKIFTGMGTGFSIILATDGGYTIGGKDWLQRIDLNGNQQWMKTLSRSGSDSWGFSIRPTSDGGYIMAGINSLLKTDKDGNEQWSKTLSGSKYFWGNSVIQAADGSYVVTGRIFPKGATKSDVYLAKVASDAISIATFGLNSGNATYNQAADSLQAMRIRNTAESGTLIKLELLIADTTPNGKVRLGIYTDNNGKPGKRLLDAGEITVANGWISVKGLNLSVTEGNYYWLAFNLQSTNGIRYQSGKASASHYSVNGVKYGALPSSFPSSGVRTNSNQYVMRGTIQ